MSRDGASPAPAGGRLTWFITLAAFAYWIANAVLRWWTAAPLGHDEARYALDASDLLLTGSATRFHYSAPGMTLVPLPGLLAGGSERALRLLPVLLGVVFLLAVWVFARRLRGPRTAAWTLVVLCTSPKLAVHSSELLSDLPSAACLLLGLTVAIGELSRGGGPRWQLTAAAPLFAAAFYLRYGSTAPIAVIGAVLVVMNTATIRRHPWPVIATIVLFAALLLPHVHSSIVSTGSATGILRSSAEIPGAAAGIAAYLRDPLYTYGVLIAPVMLIGALPLRWTKQHVALQLVAIGHIALLASTTQAQPRFVYLATVLLVMLGVDVVIAGADRAPRAVARAGAACVAVVALALCVRNLVHGVTLYRAMRAEKYPQVFIAAEVIRRDRDPSLPCELVAADDHTRLEWYSGCRTVRAQQRDVLIYELRDGMDPTPPPGRVRVAFLPSLVDVIRSSK